MFMRVSWAITKKVWPKVITNKEKIVFGQKMNLTNLADQIKNPEGRCRGIKELQNIY